MQTSKAPRKQKLPRVQSLSSSMVKESHKMYVKGILYLDSVTQGQLSLVGR